MCTWEQYEKRGGCHIGLHVMVGRYEFNIELQPMCTIVAPTSIMYCRLIGCTVYYRLQCFPTGDLWAEFGSWVVSFDPQVFRARNQQQLFKKIYKKMLDIKDQENSSKWFLFNTSVAMYSHVLVKHYICLGFLWSMYSPQNICNYVIIIINNDPCCSVSRQQTVYTIDCAVYFIYSM